LPPFDGYYKAAGNQTGKLKDGGEQAVAWRVVAADFVTIDSGSGVVHQAPAYGEVDYDVLVAEQARFVDGQGPQLLNAVAPDGKFTDEAPVYCRGRWVKECDKDIIRDLKTRGLLYHQEQYVHDYPFCWRAEEDPLIQYPRRSWFIRTTAFKDEMLANNERINWLPEHIQRGRFGNFLETNVDWALSRERYWGTPLPIWVCEQTGQMEAVSSYDELLQKPGVAGTEVWDAAKKANPSISEDLKVHKPYIDAITYDSPFAAGARMKRVPEVIDCWYDSGAMPFAQWGYRGEDGPPEARQKFHQQFPADFIAEGLDQTRGWFYSQLAISTMLFGKQVQSPKSKVQSQEPAAANLKSEIRNLKSEYPHPFKNCIVWGLMLGEWWESPDGKQVFLTEAEAKQKLGDKYTKRVGKLSKSKRNYREPRVIFDMYGADALRWYLFANQPPWSSILYAERAIKDTIPEFILRLWNCYSFFVIYANIDGFDPVGQASRLPRVRQARRLPHGPQSTSSTRQATSTASRPRTRSPPAGRKGSRRSLKPSTPKTASALLPVCTPSGFWLATAATRPAKNCSSWPSTMASRACKCRRSGLWPICPTRSW
jgi:isoleucyl-tRNA synthetase